MLWITEPLVGVLPEQFQFVVKRKHVHADLHDEILRLRVATEVGNHQALMDIVRDMEFTFSVSITLTQRLRGKCVFNSTRGTV